MITSRLRRCLVAAAILLSLLPARPEPGRAEVVRIKIHQRVPFADGHCFGRSGSYEKLSGRMFIEVDPDNPVNARIHDLKFAPRNERGRVECWTDFFLLKPVDPQRDRARYGASLKELS